MNASSDMLRRAVAVGSAISLLVAIASCVGLAASFIQPDLGLPKLYRIASLTRSVGFCFLGSYLVAGLAFPKLATMRVNAKTTSTWERSVLVIIGVVCCLLVMFSPHTYVYPDAGGWITKSKAGTFSITSGVAKEYLWRAVRMWSAIPLCGSLYVITFARQFARKPATSE
jgi:uncharacterized membrane protein